jgi:CheY-like chemotaxis protein
MTASALFGPHLPNLRRYARAMTGSQSVGDSCVRAALEAILAAPRLILDEHAPRVELFRLFHAVSEPMAASLGLKARVGRAPLLLTAIEGFSADEAGVILRLSAPEIVAAIDAAKAEIMEEMRGQVMIIEDESIIAMHLRALVEDLGHVVTGVATTRGEAATLFARTRPDLVLADIRLADGSSGIDAVKDILAAHDVPVIFITAFPERLLTGERPEPTYLITKPFLPETVTATISQALFFHRENDLLTASAE